MIVVKPFARVKLRHRAFHTAASPAGHIVAVSKDGVGSVVEPGQTKPKEFDLSSHPKGIAITLSGDLLAVAKEFALSLIRLPDFAEKQCIHGAFESCLFCGSLLWTATRTSMDTAMVDVRELNEGKVLARVEVADPFGESSLMLFRGPNEDTVALWIAAGQDGQCLYWMEHAGSTMTATRCPNLEETTPPAFDPGGRRFLVASENDLCLHDYPGGERLGKLEWPFDDDFPSETISFVGEDHALMHSGNGRLFLVDLRAMKIAEEIIVEGHGLRPTRELYPNLSDNGLCSDLSTFVSLPKGDFISVHQDLPMKSASEWRDELAFWRIPHSGKE
jgi:hypothetical protein